MKKLKLVTLESQELSKLRGGSKKIYVGSDPAPRCGCGCIYAGNGGSSSGDNAAANYQGGYFG
jgi:natural product precursor